MGKLISDDSPLGKPISAAASLNSAVAGVLWRMTAGLAVTFLISILVAAAGLVPMLFSGVQGYVIVFAPLLMSLYLAWRSDDMPLSSIKIWFVAFAVGMGMSLSLIFAVFTSASIAQALLSTTVSFGALAAWGYFTRRNISGWGPFLFAGVIGLVAAGVVNIFLTSTALQMTISVLTILIFLALTAFDMNRIRDMFWQAGDDAIPRMQWLAALSLYINFINIFISMLQLFGDRE
jgi:FtsH-binding integral membrane protein